MSRKIPFTQEQIDELKQNRYTHTVTANRIVFTLEFKQFFVQQVNEHNRKTKDILKMADYNTSYFSKSNLDYTRKFIMAEYRSETGLKAPRGLSSEERIAVFEKKNLEQQKTEASLKEMQERIVHLEKQIEFLKKISHLKKP